MRCLGCSNVEVEICRMADQKGSRRLNGAERNLRSMSANLHPTMDRARLSGP